MIPWCDQGCGESPTELGGRSARSAELYVGTERGVHKVRDTQAT